MSSALLVQQLIPQLAFLAPDRLLILLIIPALILAYIFASLRKNRRGMRFTNTSMFGWFHWVHAKRPVAESSGVE